MCNIKHMLNNYQVPGTREGAPRKWGMGMKKTYPIEVDCANCANLMEVEANKVEGVKKATVNFMMLKMTVKFEEEADPSQVMPEVLRVCRTIEPDCEIEF